MVERLTVCCGVYTSATQWRAACNNQSETSVADACAAVCKRPSLKLYQPSRKRFFRADMGRSYDQVVYSSSSSSNRRRRRRRNDQRQYRYKRNHWLKSRETMPQASRKGHWVFCVYKHSHQAITSKIKHAITLAIQLKT